MKIANIDVPFLSEEIIINILKRLPAKSLIRFQCVSKHWRSLIKNPSFTAEHLHHSTHQNPCLLFDPIDDNGTLNLHLLDCEMQLRRVPNHPLFDYLKCGGVVGSSNGLLCVDMNKEDFVPNYSLLLYNPAIREVRQVPTTCTDYDGFVGFGFSPIVDDYKIVIIYVDGMFDVVEKVEVYSLRTGSWKGLELGILNGACIISKGITANGAIFWTGFKSEDDGLYHVIISFDMAMEVFTLLPMPALAPSSYYNRLTTYENKLARLSCHLIRNSESSLIELWVMEEVAVASGGRWSWTKKYTSNPYPCFLRPMTIWKNEIVCSISTRRERENDDPNTVSFRACLLSLI